MFDSSALADELQALKGDVSSLLNIVERLIPASVTRGR